MATQKQGTVTSVEHVTPDTVVVDVELDAPLDFRGGQYVIVDSGRTLPNGKAGKRAYSILGTDTEQTRVQLATLRIDGGVVSDYVHGSKVGDRFTFSGPWGKLGARLESEQPQPTLLLATDTGITAILGLLASRHYAASLAHSTLLWLRTHDGYFLPREWVSERIPSSLASVYIGEIPNFRDPQRLGAVRATIVERFSSRHSTGRAFMAGDGSVHYGLMDELNGSGLTFGRDDVESFFNMPERKSV